MSLICPLQIQHVDARQDLPRSSRKRLKLSPQGDVVSPRGRALTEEVFALTPVEVVIEFAGMRNRYSSVTEIQQLDKLTSLKRFAFQQ